MVKFREASPGAAYEIADGVFTAEQAAELGLAVVEADGFGRPTAYGRYKDAPAGGPLGITSPKNPDTEVRAGGQVAPGDDVPAGGNKGSLINIDDPFVKGGTGDETMHADGSEPPVRDLAAEEAEQVKVAEASLEAASKPARKSAKRK